ncbi:MAG: hypothetical protein HFH93_09930 [Lachnospiraceae bacterium]|nr:hypothetical protein [Lachnospiraceae bacterium]
MISISDLKKRMERVNDYWIEQNPEPGDCAWERAAYFLGNTVAIEVLGKPRYLEYAAKWARANDWNFYDNAGHQTTNADNLICGETYLDLMNEYGIPGKMEHIRTTMEWTARDTHNDYWWWVDTMYMALNFYNRMGLLLNDHRLIDKAYRLYLNAKEERRLYDREERLWFRDENFLPEVARTAGGRKVFWARGNGWVFAGLARTLRTLPAEQKYYNEYKSVFVSMADALEKCQCEDGFWRTSLLEPQEYPMPETSGTVLTVLGMLMGVRLGILPERYMECALRGFDALNREAVEESGRIGWVQVVALKPGPVKKEASNDYAVGTYLLVCRELIACLCQ